MHRIWRGERGCSWYTAKGVMQVIGDENLRFRPWREGKEGRCDNHDLLYCPGTYRAYDMIDRAASQPATDRPPTHHHLPSTHPTKQADELS